MPRSDKLAPIGENFAILGELPHSACMSEFDFQPYLSAIVAHYANQRHLYTLTDALLPLEARSVEREEDDREKRVEQFPVLAGLRRYAIGDAREHVLLAGRPGSGKSTALRQLVVELAADGMVPVLVQLKADRTVPELIKAEFRARKVRVTDEQIEDWLVADRLVLLLDGVNEVPTEKQRQNLAEFRQANLSVPMIFTTRDLAIGGLLGISKQLEMKPLSPEQLREFVGKYLPEQGEKLLGQLHGKLPELAETPLLLKMLCDVFNPETEKIPESKGELFQWFDQDYERVKKEVEYVPVSENFWLFKSQILQYLAFSTIQADLEKPTEAWYSFARDRALTILENWLRDRGMTDAPTKAALWIKDLVNYHLLQDAVEPGKIEFHHQLFQEYYAAEYLKIELEQHPKWQQKQPGDPYTYFQHFYLNYLKWTESVTIVLSLMEGEKPAVDLVKQALDVDLMLGARLAGAARSVLQSKTVGLIQQTHSALVELPFWLFAHLLAQSNSEAAIPVLFKAIEDSDCYVREIAAKTLGEIGSEVAIPGLLKAIEDSDIGVRWNAAQALGKIGSEAAIPVLLKAIEDSDSDVRWSAAQALGKIDSEAANPLLKTIEASILGFVEAVKAVSPVLLSGLEDSARDVRRRAAEALGNIGSESTKAIEDSDRYVRRRAVEVLGEIGSEVAIPVLLKAIEDSDRYVRWSAAQALGKLKDDRAAHILPDLLKLLPAESGKNAFRAIQGIQANCKFYNYEIFRSLPANPQPTQADTLATIATTVDTIDQRTKQMADQPARTIHMSGSGNYIEKIEGGYHEHNYAPQANLKETEQLTQLLQKLRTSNPNATEEQIFDILLRGFQTMPQNNPQNWQNWQNILSLIFVGGVEGIKMVCPPAGIPIEVGRKLYDIYDHNRKQLPGA
jgi:HEAT repeat protein/energy-coupling factor transporter ATP-binding protein EcfA2